MSGGRPIGYVSSANSWALGMNRALKDTSYQFAQRLLSIRSMLASMALHRAHLYGDHYGSLCVLDSLCLLG